jgi:acyl-CoA thioesterase FadM
MPKKKLKKQNEYEFKYNITLKMRDINYGGHLGNDAVVSIAHEARIDLLNQMGLTELNLGNNKTGIIMSDLSVNYLGEGFMFDKITVFSHIDEISPASFRVFHNFTKDDKTIALVETGLITFDYSEREISEVPEEFIKKIEEYKNN